MHFKLLPNFADRVSILSLTTIISNMQNILLITLVSYTVIHLMMSAVLFLYSRYKVEYLALAWITAIFGLGGCAGIPFMLNYSGKDFPYKGETVKAKNYKLFKAK